MTSPIQQSDVVLVVDDSADTLSDKVPLKDFVYGTNILKTLIKWKYDNGPFYRYHLSLSLWTMFSKEFIEAVDVTKDLSVKSLEY